MHASAYNWVVNVLFEITPGRGDQKPERFNGVIEFGSRNVNGSIKELLNTTSYVGVDIKPGPDVDVVQDAADYRGDPVELVICMETLEHAPNWADIVKSASENLLPGGFFVMTCASTNRIPHSAVDGGPLRPDEYYQNISAEAFRGVAEKAGLVLKRLETRPQIGDLYALAVKE